MIAALLAALFVGPSSVPAQAASGREKRTTTMNDRGMAPNDGTTRASLVASNEEVAFRYFVAKGLTERQAAGVIGNLVQESGVNPTSIQPGGPGRGIAQWSVGGRWDTDTNQNMLWFARTRGLDAWALGPNWPSSGTN